MGAISLSKTDLNRGETRLMNVYKKYVDENRTSVVYPAEIKQYDGPGAAAARKVFAYGRHVEGGTDGNDYVRLSTLRKGIKKLKSALKKIADSKGDQDGRLDGTKAELGKASTAAAAFARFTHATK